MRTAYSVAHSIVIYYKRVEKDRGPLPDFPERHEIGFDIEPTNEQIKVKVEEWSQQRLSLWKVFLKKDYMIVIESVAKIKTEMIKTIELTEID